MTETQKREVEEIKNDLQEEARKGRYKCSQVCITWSREDHNCEIWGSLHPSPSHCEYFLENEARDRYNKKLEEEERTK